MSARVYASGIITKIELKEHNSEQVCVVTVPVNSADKVNGEWVEETQWWELSAWGQQAKIWFERYVKGDAIEFNGIMKPRAYQAQDGSIKMNFRCKNAYIEFSPRGRNKEARTELVPVGVADDYSDVPF